MKKSIFKRIGLICLSICVAIGSFFVGVHKNGHDNKFASADSTASSVTFTSSNIIYSCLGNTTDTPTDFNDLIYANATSPYTSLDWLNFSFKLYYDSNSNRVTPYVLGTQADEYGIVNSSGQTEFIELLSDSAGDGSYGFTNLGFNPLVFRSNVYYRNTAVAFVLNRPTHLNDGFNYPTLDMVTIEIGSFTDFSDLNKSGYSGFFNSNVVCYTDTAGFKYFFAIPCYQPKELNPYMYYDYRIYYTSNTLDFSDSQIYTQGYNQGLADNQQNIYNNGYEAGYDVGYGSGRADGIISANDYSFPGLIGAVLDVPVQTFMSLLHFEILGIDLANFILGLLTLGLVIFVIKLIMGGK